MNCGVGRELSIGECTNQFNRYVELVCTVDFWRQPCSQALAFSPYLDFSDVEEMSDNALVAALL